MANVVSFSSLNVLFVGLDLLFIAAHLFQHVTCTASFSADLIHRDSHESPLNKPASTLLSRFPTSIHRSASRTDYLRIANSHNDKSPLYPLAGNDPYAIVTNYNDVYLMTFLIGSHKKTVLAIMDTGSDLIWLLCHPCKDCYHSNQKKFGARHSLSYEELKCSSEQCSMIPHNCRDGSNCKFSYGYLNNAKIRGILSNETIQLQTTKGNKNIYQNNIIFGCTHNTEGIFPEDSLGIIGLGGGPLSLVSQLGSSYGRMFSYCLTFSYKKSSKLYFGSAAKVSGPGSVTTRLAEINPYKLTLETIIVAGAEDKPIIVRPPESVEAARHGGNIMIDSGSRFTYIDKEVMPTLWDLVKKHTPLPPIGRAANLLNMHNLDSHLELCFNISNAPENFKMPEITFNFVGNAVFVLNEENAFTLIEINTVCLGIASNEHNEGISIIGNLAQINYHIQYNLDARELTFRRKHCKLI